MDSKSSDKRESDDKKLNISELDKKQLSEDK